MIWVRGHARVIPGQPGVIFLKMYHMVTKFDQKKPWPGTNVLLGQRLCSGHPRSTAVMLLRNPLSTDQTVIHYLVKCHAGVVLGQTGLNLVRNDIWLPRTPPTKFGQKNSWSERNASFAGAGVRLSQQVSISPESPYGHQIWSEPLRRWPGVGLIAELSFKRIHSGHPWSTKRLIYLKMF